jgi:cytidyltransferase-like protein
MTAAKGPDHQETRTPIAKVGVAHGRFQIFHNDHLKYILAARELCETLVIGITSAELLATPPEPMAQHRSESSSNPLTYYERMLMVTRCLRSEGVDVAKLYVVPFPIERPSQLFNYSPPDATYFITIYDEWGEEKLRRLQELGLSTRVLWRRKYKGISGVNVRAAIASGGEWKSLVPSATAAYIEDNHIDLRIKQALDKGGRIRG